MKNRLLQFAFAGLMALTLLAAGVERRPNFLFVYTDDQRWDAMGVVQREQGEHARFPWFTTPNMDRLAAEGIRFRNAFVPLSLCSPSRAAFLTGRYNHLNGVADNFTHFPANAVSYATQLRQVGYSTAYIGKWHMDDQHERPGFDYAASFVGQGIYWDCPMEINGRAVPTKGWVDDAVTDRAIEHLQHLAHENDHPFAMVIGFKSPHEPWSPPTRAQNRFANAQARPVANMKALAAGIKEPEWNPNDPKNLNYFRVISAVDDDLGRILDALDELHLAENTVVVFTSDNGFFRGEHGLHDKRYLYDESLRIPFIVRYPKGIQQPGAMDEMVLNIDVCPTFLELAGVTIPNDVQGRSFVPLLERRATDWRQSFLAEYFVELRYPYVPPQIGVRTQTAKLVQYPGHPEWTEVFDVASDPYETKNLASDPAHVGLRKKLEAELQRLQQQTDFLVPESTPFPKPKPKSAAQLLP
ncbi:MAG: sulfatase family protein [Verrucomicrobiota bacterium]